MTDELMALRAQELLIQFREQIKPVLTDRQNELVAHAQIKINSRMRSALGRAFLIERRIDLNMRLLQKHPEELAPTLAHEFAHLVAPLVYGRDGLQHRDGWKKVMKYLNFSPDRTHSLNVEGLKARRRVKAWAICACPEIRHPIYAQRLRKMRRRYRYACLKCKSELKITSED